MTDTVFYFEFGVYDEQTDCEELINKGFIIEDYEFSSYNQNKCDAFENITSDMESKYGVHDWCTGPDSEVDGIGYGSGEVEKHKIDELMEDWQKVFIQDNATVSKVIDFDRDYEDNDHDIYQKIKRGLND